MKIFLTGGTGFIGQPLTKALLARGWNVLALVRKPDSPEARALTRMGAQCVRGDITDRESMRLGMTGADIVIHIANCRSHFPRETSTWQTSNSTNRVWKAEEYAPLQRTDQVRNQKCRPSLVWGTAPPLQELWRRLVGHKSGGPKFIPVYQIYTSRVINWSTCSTRIVLLPDYWGHTLF